MKNVLFCSRETAPVWAITAAILDRLADTQGATVSFLRTANPPRYSVGLHGFTLPFQYGSATHQTAMVRAAHAYASAFLSADGFGLWIDANGTLHVDAIGFADSYSGAAGRAMACMQTAVYDLEAAETLYLDYASGELLPAPCTVEGPYGARHTYR